MGLKVRGMGTLHAIMYGERRQSRVSHVGVSSTGGALAFIKAAIGRAARKLPILAKLLEEVLEPTEGVANGGGKRSQRQQVQPKETPPAKNPRVGTEKERRGGGRRARLAAEHTVWIAVDQAAAAEAPRLAPDQAAAAEATAE